MRRLTMKEVNEQHGGILPPDAVFRPDDGETPPSPVAPPRATTVKAKRRTRSERFAVLNAFVDFGIADADLTPAESIVWLVLFRDVKGEGTARTAQADIARRAGLDVRTVRRAVASLEAKGMLQTVRRGRLNAGPSVYRVHPITTA
ncbi:MAG: helix-turn-helix domain-containing protein [Gemmataceae bacterium]